MGRLIDADFLVSILKKSEEVAGEIIKKKVLEVFQDIVEEQPTAYDPEEVVKQLEEEVDKEFTAMNDSCLERDYFHHAARKFAFEDAIEIVKGGVK